MRGKQTLSKLPTKKERAQLDLVFNSKKKPDKEKQLNNDCIIIYNENWINDYVEVNFFLNEWYTLVKAVRYAYKELEEM